MAVKIHKGQALTSLSITPLIDIVFLLLIFFLVATRFSEEDRELDVKLPTASEAKPLIAKPKEIEINVDKEGNYYLSGQIADLDQLEQVLSTAIVNNPMNQSVVLRADRRASWDAVVQAIDTCHRVGIYDVIPTTQEQDP
jgi:biopolymer transport protein ExbD